MKLSDKQFKFAQMCMQLELWMLTHGYKFTYGEAWRPGDRRCHGFRLARDYNLFLPIEDPLGEGWVTGYQYTRKTSDHLPIGEFWESIGGSWGGRFKKKDGNHYSLEHQGNK